MSSQQVTVAEAILRAHREVMAASSEVVLLGLNAASPLGIFGTVKGLVDEFGTDRVVETPASEAGLTGIALGMATAGMHPILVHQRFDFALLAVDQLVNQVAKWHYMYGGALSAPMLTRLIVGRGWGQGPQHSQALHAWFAHIPGLTVLMSSFPEQSRHAIHWSMSVDRPVILIEHRWMHMVKGSIAEALPCGDFPSAIRRRDGNDVTLVGTSFMVLECLAAAEMLTTRGISADVVDLLKLSPLDTSEIVASVQKTGRLVVCDIGTISFGAGAEIVASVVETDEMRLRNPPRRIGLPFLPTPTASHLSAQFYPTAVQVANSVLEMLGESPDTWFVEERSPQQLDVPDHRFMGPY